jgi:competence protein ComEA
MSKQQLYLVGLVSVLVLLAVPGFFIEPPGPSQNKATGQIKELDPSVRSRIPRTTLNLQPTSEEQRQEILFSRKININEADLQELQEIPRVGEATAQRIVNFRKEGGIFYRVEDLTKIKRIGARTVENMRPHITVGRKYMEMQPETSESDKIDLNTASRRELQQITGVGPATATDIINYRDRYGGFAKIEDLRNVNGIGPKTFEKMKDSIKASRVSGITSPGLAGSSTSGVKININRADRRELTKLPGVGPATARSIIEYREKHGAFPTLDNLTEVSGIGPVTVDKIRDQAEAR